MNTKSRHPVGVSGSELARTGSIAFSMAEHFMDPHCLNLLRKSRG